MPFSTVQGKLKLSVDQLDGGLNTNDAPNKIGDFESPDCLNVMYLDDGAIQTRSGTTYFANQLANASGTLNSSPIDGMLALNSTMAVFAGGRMYRLSGVTWAQVTTASGKITSGANVEAVKYQGISFFSDGSNGPYRWEGSESLYMMGVGIPSAPNAASGVTGTLGPHAGTYYYKVAFVNSHVVTGEGSTESAGVTLTATATVNLTSVQVGTGLYGVTSRKIYRANTLLGTYGLIGTLNNNTATIFTDTIAFGLEGSAAVEDGTAPTPWRTVREHKERIFFDDSTNHSLLRFTDYQNPYISQADSFFSEANQKGESITAIGVQDDFVSVFFNKSMIWVYDLADPSDEQTWSRKLSPANLGIVGPRAFAEVPDGIVFVGTQNGKLSGVHQLSGINVAQTQDSKLRTQNIGKKIEPTLFAMPSTLLSQIACTSFQNRVYFAVPKSATSTIIDGILYFDLPRTGQSSSPGAWAPWDGINVKSFLIVDGTLYGGTSNSDARIWQFNSGSYQDATGLAINSYIWTKQFGGEGDLSYWTKDGRRVDLWYALLGTFNMRYRYRIDGDEGGGTQYEVDLTPAGPLWSTNGGGNGFFWGDGTNYGAGTSDKQSRIYIGPVVGKRFQHGFTNENTVGQYFKAFSLQSTMNLRRER